MVAKTKGLGKSLGDLGLGELLSQVDQPAVTEPSSNLRQVPIEFCQPSPYQPRRVMDPVAIKELAESIKSQGVITPLLVRQQGPEHFEIIAGERRWRAAQQAELSEVPVLVKTLSEEAAMAVALVDNIQREDLNVIEEAMALQRLVSDFGMTHEAVAKAVGRSRAAVSNLLRLLALPTEVKTLVENGDLEMGHARALLTLPSEQQNHVARDIADQGLSVRATEQHIARIKHQPKRPNQHPTKSDPNVVALEKKLSAYFGSTASLRNNKNGKGELVLCYHSLDELSGILEKMGCPQE